MGQNGKIIVKALGATTYGVCVGVDIYSMIKEALRKSTLKLIMVIITHCLAKFDDLEIKDLKTQPNEFSSSARPPIYQRYQRVPKGPNVVSAHENVYHCSVSLHGGAHFRNKRFALNEIFQRNASKFAIFYV